MSVTALLAVALGGALGASARYLVYQLTAYWLGLGFPYATITVNVLGSFIMGVLVEALALGWQLSEHLRLLLAAGVLGAFTTFSTFSLDFAVLYRRGDLGLSALYVVLSVLLSIGALFAGLTLTRRFLLGP